MTDSSPSLETLCWLLDKARALGASSADAVMFETVDISISQRLGKPEGLERSESKALGLRVFSGDKSAIVSSTDTLADTLSELAARAVTMAKAAPADPDSRLADSSFYPSSITDLELCDTGEATEEWLAEQCREAEETARNVPGITNSEGADAHYGKSVVSLAIANGGGAHFARHYPASHFSLSVSVLAGSGTGMERDYEFSSAHHRKDLLSASSVGQEAARRALKRLNPRKAASCRVPVVFDPRVSRSLVSILAGAISGSSVARGSSFLKDDMGKMIFPKHVSIVDDPLKKRGLASKPFDAEGVKTAKLTLVEKGELKRWLLDTRTASKLGLVTTGHASRSVASPPSPSATNLYMENGILAPHALIKDIQSGFYVTETFGMGVNTITGDFSQGASGFWIENGEISYPVSEITIAGHLREMFAGITPANDLAFRYATNAPTLRVDAMTIAGV